MEEKDQKTEVAQQPAEATKPENNMSNDAMMQMMKHLWPDTNEQRDKEYWRNLHRELIFHYEIQLVSEKKFSPSQETETQKFNYDEVVSKSLIYARIAMNEIQNYERNGVVIPAQDTKEAEHGE